MQVNTEKWGNSSQWQIDTNVYPASGIRDSNYAFYNGKRLTMGDYIAGGEMAYNTPIDTSICYAAHASDTKMPLADIALIGNKDGSIIATQSEDCGWFLGSQNSASRGDWQTFANLEAIKNGTPARQITTARAFLWSPNGTKTGWNAHDNNHEILKPIVKFNLRSFFGVVRVMLITNDHKTTTTIQLKTLKDNIETYKNTHYIGSVYMSMRCYQGGNSANGFNGFSYCNANNFGCAITKPFKINGSNTEILSYYQTVNSVGQLPIANIPYPERLEDNYGNYVYGVGAYTPSTSTGATYREVSYPVYMSHLVDRIDIVAGAWNSTILCPVIPITAEVIDELYKGAAAYGVFFSDDFYTLQTDTTNTARYFDNNMMLGILDKNGVGHGEYTKGLDNINNPVFQWTDSTQSPYNPSIPPKPVDTNTYSNTTGFNSISAGASATERYVLDAGNTRQLLSDLWTISHDIAGVDYDNYNYKILDSFLVMNPIDCIISLKRFPFSIPHTFSNAKTPVNLGKNHGSAQGYLTYDVFNTVEFAGINIFPRFGNSFLDYAPYTEYELYVPFCGTVKLNAGDILGHTLNCRLQIDLITGACTAYIMADSLVIETVTGTVSCELALTGIDSATIDANIQNSVLNHVNARTNKEVSMLSPTTVGGLISAASNPFKSSGGIATAKTELQRAEYELTHIQTQPHTMGTAGGLTGWYQEFNARLMIYYPEGDVITSAQPPELKNLESYGHTTGFATVNNTTLSNYSGFTVATNAILNFAATDTEKEMIMNLLQSGVYL